MKKILYSLFFLIICLPLVAQEVLLPLQMNAEIMAEDIQDRSQWGLKSGPNMIRVNLDTSLYILVDDFSYNSHWPYGYLWQDRSVYINRTFPINPITIGVATFDGMDNKGYPYNFVTPTSYGPCDTLTSQPIELNKVDAATDDPIYLTFYYQPQGINPFSNSSGDSISLEFLKPYKYDTTITNDGMGNIDTIIEKKEINEWSRVWGHEGYDLWASDTTCNFAFRKQTITVDPSYYLEGFQFRFLSFGNTSGSVDLWHLDFVVLSSDGNGHSNLGDYAFKSEIGSLITNYEAMPWFHYVGNEQSYERTKRLKYDMRNTFSQDNVTLDLEYIAIDPKGVQIDAINATAAFTEISKKNCKKESEPLPGDADHTFVFPASSAPIDSTIYFIKKSILKRRIGPVDLIQQNNEIDQFQIFGSYYAYDDGSAEAGYGVKSDKGKVAVRFVMPDGLTDTLVSIYMHFNPIIVDRSEERFRITIWDNNSGEPGNIIYQGAQIKTPVYEKKGINKFTRFYLDQPLLVSDTFYIGYQKITGEVLNIGYDLNNKNNNKLFFSIGSSWVQSSTGGSVPSGSLMIRPSFRHGEEVMVGVQKEKVKNTTSLHIYPNPVSDVLVLEVSESSQKNWTASIFSIDGRMAQTFQFKSRYELDVSQYAEGLYIIRLNNASNRHSVNSKFLVKH